MAERLLLFCRSTVPELKENSSKDVTCKYFRDLEAEYIQKSPLSQGVKTVLPIINCFLSRFSVITQNFKNKNDEHFLWFLLNGEGLSKVRKWLLHFLFFSINDPKQNARSLLTPVSDSAFYTLSHGNLHVVLRGSSNIRLFQRFWLAVEEFWPIRKWMKKLPLRAKPRLPCERAWKDGSETGAKGNLAFCLGSLI